jgi:hypothetical protein
MPANRDFQMHLKLAHFEAVIMNLFFSSNLPQDFVMHIKVIDLCFVFSFC